MSEAPLQINLTVPDLKKIQSQMLTSKEKAPLVMKRAINKTLTQISKNIGKKAKETYIVKQSAVKKTLYLKKATTRSLSGAVGSRADRKIPLYAFKVTPKDIITENDKKPEFYTARIKKRVKEKPLSGSLDRSKAFVAKMRNGHTGVFERMTGQKTSGGKEKIAELYGLSVPSMVGSREVSFDIQRSGQEFLEAQIQKEIRAVMGLK